MGTEEGEEEEREERRRRVGDGERGGSRGEDFCEDIVS